MVDSNLVEKIKNFSESEWQDFRKEKWLETCQKNSGPMPEYYLANKASYIEYIKGLEAKGKLKNISVSQVENMSDSEYQDFRKAKWDEKTKMYNPNEIPAWFIRDKESYLSFLERNSK